MNKTIVERQLVAARQNLLELNMRNRLLNFRPNKARTIRIIDEVPADVYERLVLNERFMELLPTLDENKEYQRDKSQQDLFSNNSGQVKEDTICSRNFY